MLDGSIFVDHEVFTSKSVDVDGMNFVLNQSDDSWHTKPDHHATVVAAIAAGNTCTGDNASIQYGIAPKAKLYICRVYEDHSDDDSCWNFYIAALKHLQERKKCGKVDIIVMPYCCKEKSHCIEKELNELSNQGVILIAAGGNSGAYQENAEFPASNNHVLYVGACD